MAPLRLVRRGHVARRLAPACLAITRGGGLTDPLLATVDGLADARTNDLGDIRLRHQLATCQELLEREAHALGRREAQDRLGRERAQDHALELLGKAAQQRGRRSDLALEHGVHHLVVAVAAEGTLTRRRFVEHAAEREDVAPAIHTGARDLLGRHVSDLALELPRARGFVELSERLRHAEVGHLRGAVGGEQDVVRREVAMHDAERAPVLVGQLVGGMKARAGIRDDTRDHARVDCLGLPRSAKHACERVSAHPLHRQIEGALLLSELVDLADVWMVNTRGDPRLVQEHALELGLLREVRQDRLQRDQLLEATLAVEARRPYASHPATSDGHEQLVPAEARAWLHRAVVRRLLDQLVGRQDLGHRVEDYTKVGPETCVPRSLRGAAWPATPAKMRGYAW